MEVDRRSVLFGALLRLVKSSTNIRIWFRSKILWPIEIFLLISLIVLVLISNQVLTRFLAVHLHLTISTKHLAIFNNVIVRLCANTWSIVTMFLLFLVGWYWIIVLRRVGRLLSGSSSSRTTALLRWVFIDHLVLDSLRYSLHFSNIRISFVTLLLFVRLEPPLVTIS